MSKKQLFIVSRQFSFVRLLRDLGYGLKIYCHLRSKTKILIAITWNLQINLGNIA